ncbi:MAG: hypothetical protein ACT4PJ_15180 [Gemmatimonadaceae bacterium]
MSDLDAPFQDWIAKAESDLLNIENNIGARRVPWDTVCFHGGQELTQYAIWARYPVESSPVTESEGAEAVAAARRIRASLIPLLVQER